MIKNPILKGFNPDPAICKVGGDYYIAVSTFEWFPGVRIYHSTNLADWKLCVTPLDRVSQLNLYGVADSGGVWAPDLTYSQGKFWLVYSIMKEHRSWKDVKNYLVTSEHIEGPWSEPVFLNGSGFDPAFFHGDNGKKYLINMVYDHRPANPWYYGISIQEYDSVRQELIGVPEIIFKGSEIGKTEGPHIYKKGEFYYLITAEGGTRNEHCVTVARSKNLKGPYEIHPNNPILSSWNHPELILQNAGHGSFVETESGEWYLAHIVARPMKRKNKPIREERGFSSLGRETAIQKIYWKNEWPFVVGGHVPSITVDNSEFDSINSEILEKRINKKYDFQTTELNSDFQTLRIPFNEEMGSLSERPGYLRLYGGESPTSVFNQSLIARRWESMNFSAEIKVEFIPKTFQELAGLICIYNTKNWVSCNITRNEEKGRILELAVCEGQIMSWPLGENQIILPEEGAVQLRVRVDQSIFYFEYATEQNNWKSIPFNFMSYTLSDEYITKPFTGGVGAAFTGSFIGMHCVDLTGKKQYADFDYFTYVEGEE